MAQSRTVVTNDIGRVFAQRSTGLLGCCPEYLGCVGLGGLSQSRDDNITIKCLSDTESGKYVTIEKIPGELGEVEFDLTSYLGLNGISILRQMFQDNCEATIHVHFGVCSNPQIFTEFDKAIVLDTVFFNSYDTDPLITLDSTGRNVVTETATATAENVYEYFAKKNFSLVSKISATEPLVMHLMPGDGCGSACVFCSNCTLQQCAENFWTIPNDDTFIASFADANTIYTIEADGVIKRWNYALLINGELSCSTLNNVELESGETITAAGYYDGLVTIGTDFGNIYLYNINNGQQSLATTLANPVSIITVNKFGYLAASSIGNVYYSSDGEIWGAATTTGAGSVTAMLLYSPTSWLVANTNTNLYYTNNTGDDYVVKRYPSVTEEPITQFAISNASILHAINDTYYYQTFDAGCNWSAIDLSKYFSQLFSLAVCPNNPFVVYLAGLSTDGTQTYIVEINFGA